MDKLNVKITYKFIVLDDTENFEISQKAIEAKIRALDFIIKKIVFKTD